VDESDNKVALVKHRCLKQVREHIEKLNVLADPSSDVFEDLINEVWQSQRLSCPKRSTIGAYLLKTLDENWHSYVYFHLNKIGCQFCKANLEDLQRQTAESKTSDLHIRIMESTVGFHHKP
jgi:hypothetical protein